MKKSTKPTTAEPEVMGPADVAPAPKPKKSQPILYLDAVSSYLKQLPGEEEEAEEIILDVFGDSDQAMPARMLAFLRDAKADGRFVIEKRGNDTYISLGSVASLAAESPLDPMDEGPADPAPATIGEMVVATQAQPKFPYPVVVGMPVILKTEGSPDAMARIVAVHDHGATCTYDLELPDGRIDGVPAFRLAPHPEAEALYANREMRLACLERHQTKLHELSQQYFSLKSDEVRIAKQLSDLRKKIDGLADEIAEHGRSDAIQTELNDIIGDGSVKQEDARTETQRRIAEGDVLTDEHLIDQRLPELLAAVLPKSASTGKPPKLTPIAFEDGPYVLVDVQDGVAVLLPAFTHEAWVEAFGELHGTPADLPSDLLPEHPQGKHFGFPVKVGRKVLHLGRDTDALLLRVPATFAMPGAEPELAMSGKDAAAGE